MKKLSKTIVLAGGCFDILHEGHLKFLEAAKKQGDILIVALESDENVKRLKGTDRPINKEQIRAGNLIKTNLVDYVILLPPFKHGADYLKMVKLVSPDVIAITTGDPKFFSKQKQAETVGAKLKIVINRLPGLSTSEIIKNRH